MSQNRLWSRRKFSKAALSAQLLLSSGLLHLPTGCGKGETQHQAAFDDSARDLLRLAMDEIIPAGIGMPAASQLNGVNYILGVLERFPDLVAPFVSIIDDLRKTSQNTCSLDFRQLDQTQRVQVLADYESSNPQLFGILKNFVFESYYTNEAVWELIGYEAHPTNSAGPKMEPFQPELLERVKKLPPLYKKSHS